MALSNLALQEESPLWTKETMQELGVFLMPMSFHKGETILHPLKPNHSLYLVERGVVNYRYYSDGGAAVTILQKRPGDIFGLETIFGRRKENKDYHIVAGTNVKLFKISGEDFFNQIRSNADFSKSVIQYFAEYIDSMEQKMAHSAVMDSYKRVVSKLIDCAEKENESDYVVQMTQQDLAEVLFLSRQRVSTHLSKLAKQDVISVKRGRIEILDWDALKQEGK